MNMERSDDVHAPPAHACCCLPRRLRQVVCTPRAVCAQCRQPRVTAAAGVRPAGETVAYACTDPATPLRVHYFVVMYCSDACGDALHVDLAHSGHEALLERFPFRVRDMDASGKETLAALVRRRQEQRRGRATPGVTCAWCTAQHFAATGVPPFQACSGCRAVRYCSKACQSDHWRQGGHARDCRVPRLVVADKDDGDEE
jgi:hypothetical protein